MTMFDREQIRRAFGRAAKSYETHAVLQREIESRLLERLELLQAPPARVLDVGCGTGHATALLRKRYRQAEVIALDFALPMLKQARRHAGWWNPYSLVCADANALPVQDASVDLLFCNLCLQWCEDLPLVFGEFRRVMCPGGLLLISTFGPDTLHELRTAWAQVDAVPHVNHFPDMMRVGDILLSTGFRDPVLDTENVLLTYVNIRTLMSELKAIGATNANSQRSRTLTGKKHLNEVAVAYEKFRINSRLPATYEVIYAQAFAPESGQPHRNQEGDIAHFSIEKLRGSRRRS